MNAADQKQVQDMIAAAMRAVPDMVATALRGADVNTLVRQLQGQVPLQGTGSPEGVVTAPVGRIFVREDGGIGSTMYVKESGTGNTGWASK